METMVSPKPEELQKKFEAARTVLTNLKSFKDWSFAAYKVEEHEKDVVIEGMTYYLHKLQAGIELQKLAAEVNNQAKSDEEEQEHDLTEVCD